MPIVNFNFNMLMLVIKLIRVVVLDESPRPRGSSRNNLQVLVLEYCKFWFLSKP